MLVSSAPEISCCGVDCVLALFGVTLTSWMLSPGTQSAAALLGVSQWGREALCFRLFNYSGWRKKNLRKIPWNSPLFTISYTPLMDTCVECLVPCECVHLCCTWCLDIPENKPQCFVVLLPEEFKFVI